MILVSPWPTLPKPIIANLYFFIIYSPSFVYFY
jgi:hypothetical protein